MRLSPPHRSVRVAAFAAVLALLGGAAGGVLGTCGPFTDAAADAFCPFVLEIFYLGITTGTTATTYDPGANVSRLQMAAFLSRTVPELEAISLPFQFDNREQAFRVVDGPVGQLLDGKLGDKGLISLGFLELGARHGRSAICARATRPS